METNAHLQLKRLAIRFLRGLGGQAVATEVRCPIARYRVDVAGYLDRSPAEPPNGRRRRGEPATVLIECKQSRPDFLRDHREADRLLARRDELERLRRHIEEARIKTHEPHLRQTGTSLFPELEEWNFGASRLRGYRRLLRTMEAVDQQLHGETKFFVIARYRLADRLYVAAPRGMIRPRDLPRGWGLLESSKRGGDGELNVAVEAPPQSAQPRHRVRLLRNIAVAASRVALERTRA
ncbi:MAG: hypothetical protein ACYS1E_05215 [Planctomycetota bacterium]